MSTMSTRQIAQAIVRRAFAPYDPASALGEQYERVVYAVEVALTKETPVEMEGDLLADLAIYKRTPR